MQKRKEISGSLPATTNTETAIDTLTVPEGHTYNVLEYNFIVPTGSTVNGYIVDEKVVEATPGGIVDVRRVEVNWELTAGMQFRVTGTNPSGGALTVGISLVYDDVLS